MKETTFTFKKSFRWLIESESVGVGEHFAQKFRFSGNTLEIDYLDVDDDAFQSSILNMRKLKNEDITLVFTDSKGNTLSKEIFEKCEFKDEKGSGDYASPDPFIRTFVFEFASKRYES